MIILGINAFHGDSSAVVLRDGALVCGVEEERLNRIKHWAGFPGGAIRTVLADARAGLGDVQHVAISRNPSAHLLEKVLFTFRRRPGLEMIRSRLANHRRVDHLDAQLSRWSHGNEPFQGKVHNIEHHRAHLASAFFCSPFEEAACLTVDAFGDFLSSLSAVGRGATIEVLDDVVFPHSLGIAYTAVTQFLGFPKYGDEYKVMGLAAYGKPTFLDAMRRMVRVAAAGQFEVDLDYFLHASDGVTSSWEGGEPSVGRVWSQKFVEVFGAAREPGEELTDRHRDLAASLQALYEEVFFHRLRWLQKKTGLKRLCLAGGCAFNSVANGKIFRNTDFSDVFIQSAAGDAGTALGAALYVWHQLLGNPRDFVMRHSYWGPEFGDALIQQSLAAKKADLEAEGCTVTRVEEEAVLCSLTAEKIAQGQIVGWYQGRGEWGPRALGNRSIVVDPRRPEMRDVLNSRIKRREPFRPFAPSILEERVGDYFEETYPDPFMIKVYPIRPEKRGEIPAVTHVDGTGRLQTVSREQNARYWNLIHAFEQRTGVPVLLNTSFNENEPIVNTPTEAIACFQRTKMDLLILGNWMVERSIRR